MEDTILEIWKHAELVIIETRAIPRKPSVIIQFAAYNSDNKMALSSLSLSDPYITPLFPTNVALWKDLKYRLLTQLGIRVRHLIILCSSYCDEKRSDKKIKILIL